MDVRPRMTLAPPPAPCVVSEKPRQVCAIPGTTVQYQVLEKAWSQVCARVEIPPRWPSARKAPADLATTYRSQYRTTHPSAWFARIVPCRVIPSGAPEEPWVARVCLPAAGLEASASVLPSRDVTIMGPAGYNSIGGSFRRSTLPSLIR
jgi:hypothetical protein